MNVQYQNAINTIQGWLYYRRSFRLFSLNYPHLFLELSILPLSLTRNYAANKEQRFGFQQKQCWGHFTAFRFGALKSYFHHRSSASTSACRGCCQSELGLDSLWELLSYRSTQRSKSCFKGWCRCGSWFLMSHGGEGLKEFVTRRSHLVEVWVLG